MIKIIDLHYLKTKKSFFSHHNKIIFDLKIPFLKINTGEILGIYGQNGSGKTTFVEILAGTKSFNQGLIEITEQEPLFSAVFQDSQFDEIAIGKILIFLNQANGNQANTVAMLNDFELTNLQNNKFKELSFGQQQRFRLIIALLKPFSILILDEVTTGMDAQWKRKVEKLLQDVMKMNKTVIMISHNEDELIKYCPRILFMKNGRIKDDFQLIGTEKNKKTIFLEKISYLTEKGEINE